MNVKKGKIINWEDDYKRKVVSLTEMAKQIKSGDVVVTALGVGACSPDVYHAILDRHEQLRNVWIVDSVQVRPCKLYESGIYGEHRRSYKLYAWLWSGHSS